MLHHLILLEDEQNLHIENGMLVSGRRKIAIEVLASVQCFSSRSQWSQGALDALAGKCPLVFARWDNKTKKWSTFTLATRSRYVNPTALEKLCKLTERKATKFASDLIFAKIKNQHTLLRSYDPILPPAPQLLDTSFSRILRLESKYARFFWAKYFKAASQDLFAREKRGAKAPLNIALNYGYGFLYHALEWQCLACGLDPTVGIVHRLRRSRPNLVCDLIEPFRCCVELTVMRYLDEIHDKKAMAARFAGMMEEKYHYRDQKFRLRTILRLSVESFTRAICSNLPHHPFALHARDACL